MSETTDLNLREQIARIDRTLAETQKFQAEQWKLFAEAGKLDREQWKLFAEAGKLNRDRVVAPWLALTAVIGGALGLATFLSRLMADDVVDTSCACLKQPRQ